MPTAPLPTSTTDLVVLLPPSEGKASGGAASRGWQPGSGSFRRLADARRTVIAALGDADGGDAKLLGASGARLEAARAANRELVGAPTMPAWARYTGVVWEHLDPATLSPAQRRQLLVPSRLTGIARGDDPIPDYRLKMGARLAPLGLLSRWWRPTVSSAVNRRSRGRFVVDLLPNEHRAAWQPDHGTSGVRLELREPSGAAGGHFAKAAKGQLARALLERGKDAIDDWSDERFVIDVVPLS